MRECVAARHAPSCMLRLLCRLTRAGAFCRAVGGGLKQKKDGNFSAGGGGGVRSFQDIAQRASSSKHRGVMLTVVRRRGQFTIHEFDPKKLNVGGGFGITKGLAVANNSAANYRRALASSSFRGLSLHLCSL